MTIGCRFKDARLGRLKVLYYTGVSWTCAPANRRHTQTLRLPPLRGLQTDGNRVFVISAKEHSTLVPKSEETGKYSYGVEIEAEVKHVKGDGGSPGPNHRSNYYRAAHPQHGAGPVRNGL